MTRILTEANQVALWHDLVRDAAHASGRELGEEMEAYLVFALMRHSQSPRLVSATLALDFLHGLALSGSRREQELQEVGDRCLLIAGLYPEQANRRHVSLAYFHGLGSQAYQQLGQDLRQSLARLFDALAAAFGRLVGVLIEVRRLTREVEPLLAHELCRLGSMEAEQAFPGRVLVAGSDRPS